MPRPVPTAPTILAALAVSLFLALVGPASAAAAPSYRGAQVHSLWAESTYAEMDRELDLLSGAGANMVRVDVVWGSIETGGKGARSPWYVEKLDRFMAGAQARGLKVIATLWSTPCWASSAPSSLKQNCEGAWWERGVQAYPPTNTGDYADIARWFAARYGDRLAAVEVWNEPNLSESTFWKTPNKAADYARLLRAAYPAVKQGNPAVPVLAGSLAFADRPFLDELYSHGIKGSYDAMAIHPYNEWRAPGDLWQEEWKKYTFLPGLEWIRQGQLAAGDTSPIWITEFGWTTCTGDRWCVTEELQARYIGEAFELMKGMDYIQAAAVYGLRNNGASSSGEWNNWGLVRRDFSPKPSYAAFKSAMASYAGFPTDGATTPPPPTETTEPPPTRPRGRKKPRIVSLRRVVRGGVVYANGRSTRAGSRVRIVARRCSRRPRVVRFTRARRDGTFRRRIGRAARLRGCSLRASAVHRA